MKPKIGKRKDPEINREPNKPTNDQEDPAKIYHNKKVILIDMDNSGFEGDQMTDEEKL